MLSKHVRDASNESICRLSTIRNADQIAVLGRGTIAELDTYTVLASRKDGLFRQLIDKQQFQFTVAEEF